MAGIASPFSPFPHQMSVLERVNITLLRHKHDYFKDWPLEKFNEEDIPTDARPIAVVTHESYKANIKKNEICRNKRLQWVMQVATSVDAPGWAKDFLNQLETGAISVTKAKDISSVLWRNHSDQYDKARAVQEPSQNPGEGHAIKRKRGPEEPQYSYRKRSAKEKTETSIEDNQTAVRKVLTFQSMMKDILQMSKEDLKRGLQAKTDTVKILQQHCDIETRTIESLRISLMTARKTVNFTFMFI